VGITEPFPAREGRPRERVTPANNTGRLPFTLFAGFDPKGSVTPPHPLEWAPRLHDAVGAPTHGVAEDLADFFLKVDGVGFMAGLEVEHPALT